MCHLSMATTQQGNCSPCYTTPNPSHHPSGKDQNKRYIATLLIWASVSLTARVWQLLWLQQAQEPPQPTPYASSHPEQFPSYLFNHLDPLWLHSNACMQIYIHLYIIKSTDLLTTVLSIIPHRCLIILFLALWACKWSLTPKEITMRLVTPAVLDLEGKQFHSWAPSVRPPCQKLFTSPSS